MIYHLSLLASVASWSVGVERETTPGVYMRLLYEAQGWSVWRYEDQTFTDCEIGKGSNGRLVRPVANAAGYLGGGEPSLGMTDGKWSIHGFGSHGERLQYRVLGARFFNDVKGRELPDFPDGAKVEVVWTAWDSQLLIERYDQRGIIDFAGKINALAALARCQEQISKDGGLTPGG